MILMPTSDRQKALSQPYLVQHLFLLMGENPLPNAVAALTLLAPGGIPYLVHTSRTERAAARLQAVLQEFKALKSPQLINLKDYQADAFQIRRRIQSRAATLTGPVGLNYTGGTKVMAVHATRAVEAAHPQAVFSYLDSNTLEMLVDQDKAPPVRFKAIPQFTLGQLFRLHGLTWRQAQPPLKQPVQPEAAAKLADMFARSPHLARAWRQWCHQVLRPATKSDRDFWKSEAELALVQPLSLAGLPAPLVSLWADYLGATGLTYALATALNHGFTSLTQLCEWLDGIWLEHHTLHQIQQVAAALAIHDSRLGFPIADPLRPQHPWPKFEFDVACVRHYQLFALSCTTSESRKLCKQKLMEASTRARQLGGTEARVGLVCCRGDTEQLCSELEVEIRDRKIAVFGRQDLPQLGQKFAKWVESNG